MKTLIAGSQGCTNPDILLEAIAMAPWTITSVVSGTAMGADTLGEEWAKANGLPLDLYPAKWRLQGQAAGFIRNTLMAENAEALIALWDGKSPGTNNMIATARKMGLKVYVYVYSEFDNIWVPRV